MLNRITIIIIIVIVIIVVIILSLRFCACSRAVHARTQHHQEGFGSDAMLGPLDENDPDMAGDEDDGDDGGVGGDDELTAALAKAHI